MAGIAAMAESSSTFLAVDFSHFCLLGAIPVILSSSDKLWAYYLQI